MQRFFPRLACCVCGAGNEDVVGLTRDSRSFPFAEKDPAGAPGLQKNSSFPRKKPIIILDFWELGVAEAVICLCDGVVCLARAH
jgi:hypothetical protein